MVAIDERVAQQKLSARAQCSCCGQPRGGGEGGQGRGAAPEKAGHLIRAHVPIGASHLSHALKEATLKMESNRESGVVMDYPSLVPELISASALMEDSGATTYTRRPPQ